MMRLAGRVIGYGYGVGTHIGGARERRAEGRLYVGAFGSAPRTTGVLAPDGMVNGLAGLESTPLGAPASIT